MYDYSIFETIKKHKGKLNIFVAQEIQENLKEVKACKQVNIFTPEEFTTIYQTILNGKFCDYCKSIEKLYRGIHISTEISQLRKCPPTTISIWIDKKYIPYDEWDNHINLPNFYVVHSMEELIEMIEYLINTCNKSHEFTEQYDNNVVANWVEHIQSKQLED